MPRINENYVLIKKKHGKKSQVEVTGLPIKKIWLMRIKSGRTNSPFLIKRSGSSRFTQY